MVSGGIAGSASKPVDGKTRVDVDGDGKLDKISWMAVRYTDFGDRGLWPIEFEINTGKNAEGQDRFVPLGDIREMRIGDKQYEVGDDIGGKRIDGFSMSWRRNSSDEPRLPKEGERVCTSITVYVSPYTGYRNNTLSPKVETIISACVTMENGAYRLVTDE